MKPEQCKELDAYMAEIRGHMDALYELAKQVDKPRALHDIHRANSRIGSVRSHLFLEADAPRPRRRPGGINDGDTLLKRRLADAIDALDTFTIAIDPRSGRQADPDVYRDVQREHGGAVAIAWQEARTQVKSFRRLAESSTA